MSNLLKLVQPKDYKSKLRLYCKNCIIDNISPKIVAQVKKNDYICRIKITEYEKQNN